MVVVVLKVVAAAAVARLRAVKVVVLLGRSPSSQPPSFNPDTISVQEVMQAVVRSQALELHQHTQAVITLVVPVFHTHLVVALRHGA